MTLRKRGRDYLQNNAMIAPLGMSLNSSMEKFAAKSTVGGYYRTKVTVGDLVHNVVRVQIIIPR